MFEKESKLVPQGGHLKTSDTEQASLFIMNNKRHQTITNTYK
jgi:hypothetical protein